MLPRMLAGGLILAGLAVQAPAQTPAPAPKPVPGSAPAAAGRPTNDVQAQAVELLRRVIKEQQQNPNRVIRTPVVPGSATGAPGALRPDQAELERQFLDGRISAKEFQKALEDLERNPPPPAPKPAPKAVVKDPALSPKAASNSPGKIITNAPATVVSTPEDAPEQKTLSDVEAKIDEILAKRRAQVEASKTNGAPAAAGPLTKRQKLDALLRAVIQGKLTDAEYKVEREKILAQPD